MPTPALYADGNPAHFADVPEVFQSNTIDVLYVTDRAREDLEDGTFRYTNGRSASLAYGSAIVRVGEHDTSWDQIVASSTSASGGRFRIGVTSMTEVDRLPETPLPPVMEDGLIVDDPAGVAEQHAAALQFCESMGRRLALTPRKEVFIFVHGINNTFDNAVCRVAGLWHFLGREGVPIAYTWPAGAPGLFGYFRDRESGEFTIFHLKQFLRVLSQCPELEHIHVIAHSRGTDVALSALRELFIEARAAGDDLRQRFKIRTIVLAAADVDLEVAQQRIVAERMGNGAEQSIVYVSPNDRAIGLSQWLFNSIDRIGNLRVQEFQAVRQSLPPGDRLQFINVEERTGFLSHSYFLDNPAVSSDLVLVLRFNRPPGVEHGRPLIPLYEGFWLIKPDYPWTDVPESSEHAPGNEVPTAP